MDSYPKPLAVVGISCRVPGANSPTEFWDMIKGGRDATGELPDDLIDRELYFDPEKGVLGKSYSCVGGLVDRLPFDNSKCRIPEDTVGNYDPAHLTTCEVASDAFRSAGMDPFNLRTKNVGVYIGHTGGTNKAGDIIFAIYIEQVANYLTQLESLGQLTAAEKQTIIDRLIADVRSENDHREVNDNLTLESSTAAQLISSTFGLQGPSMVIDAACASSLQALAIAARALQQGSIEAALVGGSSVCKKESLILFSAAQSVTNDRSRPFDEEASGLVTSEGYITVVLKTLEAAIRDGDPIRCVIRGVGMSADGKGKSLWAPLKNGQKLAVQRAYEQCEFTPEDIQFVEAHATSTQVGDATEVSALAETFPQPKPGQPKIALGSVKANVGHTLEAAGMAGMVKTILAMEHETIPPCANLENPNSNIDWDAIPFDLPLAARPWQRPAEGETRKAAVNSFGIGGLNVHIILEEYMASKPASYYGINGDVNAKVKAGPHEPIAVVGMGTILPGAQSPEEFWNLLSSGEDPKCDAPKNRWDTDRFYSPEQQAKYRSIGKRGGYITDYQYDWRSHKVPPKQVANANPLQFEMLDAADKALKNSGYHGDNLPEDRVGVVVGSVFGGEFANQLQVGLRLPELGQRLRRLFAEQGIQIPDMESVLKEFDAKVLKDMPALIDETGSFTSSTLASRITKTFNLKGGALSLDGGLSTGLAALSVCLDTLRSGDCDIMLCAVGDRCMDLAVYESLSRQGMLAGDPRHPDFDVNSQGVVPGEGCGVLALKRLSDAERDGDEVIAVIRGVGCGGDWKEPGSAIRQAIQRGWQQAGVTADDVCAMDVVGSLRDLEEQTLKQIVAECTGRTAQDPLLVGSIVSQFGFMGANHSLASTIKACLAQQHNQIPAGMATQNPREGLFANHVVPLQQTKQIDLAGPTSIGVVCGMEKGLAYHAVIDTARKPAQQTSQPSQAPAVSMPADSRTAPLITRIGATSWDELQQQLASATVESLLQSRNNFQIQDRVRLAFVSQDSVQLRDQLAKAVSEFDQLQPKLRDRWVGSGIFYGQPRADFCSTAFLFPGLGSQYPGMFQELIETVPAAVRSAEQVDSAFTLLGLKPLTDLIGKEAQGLGKAVWRTQTSMLASSWIVDRTLRDRGFRPTVAAGHSFGEYSAITSVGGFSITDAIRASLHRAEAIEESASAKGHMVATSAPMKIIEQVVQSIPGAAFVANINSRDQTVLAGTTQGMEEAAQKLTDLKQVAIKIDVPCPFHSPLLQPVAENLLRRLQTLPLQELTVPVVSTAGLGELTTRDEILNSLGNQLVTKVDFPSILQQVLSHRPALAIEVGPKQVLTRLGKKNCAESGVVFMATDNSQRRGEMAIADIQAQAECLDCLEPGSRATHPSFRGKRGDAQFIVFDATEKRRERLRAESQQGGKPAKAEPTNRLKPQPTAPAPVKSAHEIPGSTASNGNGLHNRLTNGPASSPTPMKAPVAAPAEASQARAESPAPSVKKVEQPVPTEPVAQASGIAESEIRKVLVEFVVEQTGYPEEIIELDADLEADLGIDSIKKAQLFGEVGAHFRIAPREDLSLDDFPTLEHVLAFLREELGASKAPTAAKVKVEPQPEQNNGSEHSATNGTAATPSVPEPVALPTKPMPPAESNSGVATEELRQVLIDFVVEQTGYPEEIIELDADLEADLGIDSIKKAQLFGEVGAHFQIAPRDDLSLDDFPTLGHVLEFLTEEVGGSPSGISSTAATAQVETSAPAPIAEEPIEEIHPPSPPAPVAEIAEIPAATGGGVSDSEIQRVLVDFVVEQTGYPEEIIELDADLEADLGIDSIKKAQLFGEVGAHFRIAPREDLSLDDFPTLGHVLQFLQEELGASSGSSVASESVAAAIADPEPSSPIVEPPPMPVADPLPGPVSDRPVLQVVELYGTADQRGRQYGETLNGEVQAALTRMLDSWMEPMTQGTAEWPCALNDALKGAALGAGVNHAAVANLNLQHRPMENWSCGFGSAAGLASKAQHLLSPIAVHVHHEVEQLSYLGVAEVGQIHVRAGINSARLAVSCECLSPEIAAEDVVKVTGRLHQVLAKSTTVAAASEMLRELSLDGQWCVGLQGRDVSAATYLLLDNAGIQNANANQPSTLQHAFHQSLSDDPTALHLVDRTTGAVTDLALETYLPEPKDISAFETANTAAETVMQRWVMRTTEASLPPANPRSACLNQRFGILGRSRTSEALLKLIDDYDGKACIGETIEEVIAAFGGEAPEHLILTTCADQAERSVVDSKPSELFVELFTDLQRWIAKIVAQAPQQEVSLSMITRLGGDFGFTSSITDFAGGGLTGLAKAMRRELAPLKVKVVDCDAAVSDAEAANFLLEELASGATDLEVAYRNNQRYVVQAVAEPLAQTDATNITDGGVWVCTGGGRGVTAIVARELGRRCHLKLNLVGTAPLPAGDARWRGKNPQELKELKRQMALEARESGKSPADEWSRVEKAMELDASLREFDEAGIQWQYHSCDVTSREQVDAMLQQIRREQGPIEGIVHGAGIEAACKFPSKKPENVARTIASKCDGAALLMELTASDPLRYFVGFGSTSGRFGGLGQADYSLASDMLAKMTSAFAQQRSDVKTVSFHWPAWGDVGMAMRPESRMALEASGMTYMPALEGAQHLIGELLAGAKEREVLLLDEGGMLDTDGTMTRTSTPTTVSTQASALPGAEKPQTAVAPTAGSPCEMQVPAGGFDVSHVPLIDSLVALDDGRTFEATCLLDPVKDPFLAYHRFRNRPFLPGVISMEMMAEAAQLVSPEQQFIGLSKVALEKGLAFDSDQPREVRVRLEKTPAGVECKVVAPFANSRGDVMKEERVYSSALVEFGELPNIEPIDPGQPLFGWSPFYYPEEIVIHHGNPMQSLHQLDYKHGGGRAKLFSGSLQQVIGDRQPRQFTIPCLALDGSMVCCGFFGFCMLETTVGLPHAMESIRLVRLPSDHETCMLRFFYKESNSVGELYDFILLGEAGDVVLDVKGYQTALVLDTD